MIHLAARCASSGAFHGSWMYWRGKFFKTGWYFLLQLVTSQHCLPLAVIEHNLLDKVSVGIDFTPEFDGAVAVEELVEEWWTREPHPRASIDRPVSIKQQLLEYLHKNAFNWTILISCSLFLTSFWTKTIQLYLEFLLRSGMWHDSF